MTFSGAARQSTCLIGAIKELPFTWWLKPQCEAVRDPPRTSCEDNRVQVVRGVAVAPLT
jgi:hypothetical protein